MSSTGLESELFIRISPGSVILAVMILNAAMMIAGFMRRSTRLLNAFSSAPLLLLWLSGMARAMFPVEFSFARQIPKPAWLTLSPFTFEITFVWLLGSVAAAIHWGSLLRQEALLRRSFVPSNSEQVSRLAERIGLRNVRITVSPDVKVPFVVGFFRPHIYLPLLRTSDRELEWILRHELRHVQLKDPLIKAAYLGLMICFWWNPAVYAFRAELDRLLELRCDASLTRHCDETDRHGYLTTLLTVMRQSGEKPQQQLTAAALTDLSDKESIKQRFRVVMEHPLPSARLIAIMTLGTMGVHLLTYFVTL